MLFFLLFSAVCARVFKNAAPVRHRPIAGHYLIQARPGLAVDLFKQHLEALRSPVKYVYRFGDTFAYAASLDDDTLALVAKNPAIQSIEPDSYVSIHLQVQRGAPWGIARMAHHKQPQGAEANTFRFPDTAGRNVTAYIIDTGVFINHSDFNGRASWGATFCSLDPTNDDGNGHGTHVAGTVGGSIHGVAKNVNIVAVKVLGSQGEGTMSDVIKGVEWAVKHHLSRKTRDKKAKSVANMSLGGSRSAILDRAINHAAENGIHMAVAAGNDFTDACRESPAAAEKAITVGATDSYDNLACFSNHGKCVDILAPGQDILSTWIGSNNATNIISGTSMASPHICGLMALLQSEHGPLDHVSIKEFLVKYATKGACNLPKKGHADYPDCPYVVRRGNPEGKTPNRIAYVLEDVISPTHFTGREIFRFNGHRSHQLYANY